MAVNCLLTYPESFVRKFGIGIAFYKGWQRPKASKEQGGNVLEC